MWSSQQSRVTKHTVPNLFFIYDLQFYPFSYLKKINSYLLIINKFILFENYKQGLKKR
jgi:hypothetical protein